MLLAKKLDGILNNIGIFILIVINLYLTSQISMFLYLLNLKSNHQKANYEYFLIDIIGYVLLDGNIVYLYIAINNQ